MVNANKFIIISIEALGQSSVSRMQRLGACVSVCGSILYGMARQQIEQEANERPLEIHDRCQLWRLYETFITCFATCYSDPQV